MHKYGHVIGMTGAPVRAGEHVHTHNLTMPPNATEVATSGPAAAVPEVPADLPRTFAGIVRPDGRVATRNYIGVLTTVNCSATVAKQIVRRTEDEVAEMHAEGVDGVVALTHGTGCGMANSGAGWDVLRRTLIGYARHPNIGGLVVVGLGCEINAMRSLVDEMNLPAWLPLSSYTIQDVGGTAAAVREGVRRVREMADTMRGTPRRPVGVEHLVLGMQCGGSDAWSALTANPALGVASDYLVALGATSMLGETPEIYGAEQMLAERATSDAVRDKLMERIRWWERYTTARGTTIDGNPSPGNKAGGITTILEKSLGSVAKGGQSPLAEIVDYAAVCHHHRLHHRPRLGVRVPPGADGQAGHQLGAGDKDERRHRRRLLRGRRGRRAPRGDGTAGLPPADRGGVRGPLAERGPGPGRRGDRAVADRSGPVSERSERTIDTAPRRRVDSRGADRAQRGSAGSRLDPTALSHLTESPTLSLPARITAASTVGVVHLGIGAFHRSHQAVYTEDAALAAGDLGWGICGVMQRSASVRDQLAPQDGLYGILQKDADVPASLRITGIVREVLDGPTQPDDVLDRWPTRPSRW